MIRPVKRSTRLIATARTFYWSTDGEQIGVIDGAASIVPACGSRRGRRSHDAVGRSGPGERHGRSILCRHGAGRPRRPSPSGTATGRRARVTRVPFVVVRKRHLLTTRRGPGRFRVTHRVARGR